MVRTALEILDEYGLADLSMRRVATRLDVQPGALYHHVDNKQTLLAGVADEILAHVVCPPGPWRESIEGWTLNLRAGLLSHRDSADVVASSRAFDLVSVDVLGAPVLVLAAGGMAEPIARAAATTLWHFVLGHVAEEQARRDWVRLANPGRDRQLADDEQRFRTGVGLIIDGAAAQA